jgi:hypothetical protein
MKRITAFSLFAFAGILGTGAALAQQHPIQATMPFDFTVGSRQLPAGTYRIIPVRDNIVAIENRETRTSILSAVSSDTEQPTKGAQLVFNKYGDRYFLREVLGGTAALNVSLPASKSENRAQRQQTMAENHSQISIPAEGY